ncbi:tetratricopeptide repeat protein [Streptomyces sp. NPDC058700]|uniref:tetratricopeptide repeat protein n=1 Tax=Streptomyces sp. NPDC058700 TaxID=3346607 RepID=UPI0036502423
MVEQLSGVARNVRDLLESRDEDPDIGGRLDVLLPALRAAAAAGDVGAQNVLGGVLLEVEEDPSAAAHWFERAGASGSVVGKRSLGHLYANGLGVPQDLAKGEALFAAAAAGGDAYAQFNLAQLWWGTGDPQEAVLLLRNAAGGGVAEAYAPLGDLLAAQGDDAAALRAYVDGAERGVATAMYVAACWYRDGIVGRPDEETALFGCSEPVTPTALAQPSRWPGP